MDMCLYFSICAWVVILLNEPFTLDASTTGDIILTPVNSQVIYSFNSSEPVCNSPPDCDSVGTCCTCEVFVSSPSETILNVTFLALQIPSDDTITFINRNTSEDLLSLSGISSLIDPIYSDSSRVKISFDWCDGTTPYSYLEAEFSFLDRFQDSLVRSSGGAFELSDAYPSITIQSVNLSSSTDLEGQLHWFITSSNYTWIKIETLVMEPGQGMLCIFDTFDTYGEWVCMTDSVSSTTWYSHDDEMRMTFYINQDQQPGVGVTVKLSIIDHSLWTGQYLILPACNPTVIQEYTQTIQFVTPYFNQSLQNVRYQCRMRFTSRDAPASVEFKHFDLPDGTVSIYSLESGNRVDLADAQSIQVDISSHSPVVSLSPTHEMILDVYKHGYPGDGNGLMVQAYTFDPGPEPIASFGIAIELNDTSSSRSFTTLGYPILPGCDINVRWFIDRVLPNTTIKVQFIDFHIGTATLFIREMDDPPIYQLTGYSLPDDIYSHTQMLTLVLRSDQPCCTRGFYFNVTLIQVVDECTNAPCENGGTCIDTMELFSCSCPNGFIGSLCQNPITTVGLVTELPTTQQGNTADTTIATLSASTFSETSTPVKSTLETSTSRTADLVTTSRIETSTPVIPTLETSTSRTTSCIVSEDPSPDDNNILIIALISLTIAFCLIAFLMCMMVYRISTLIKAPVAASTNHSSQIDLVATNTPTSLNGRSNSINVHNYDDVPPPTPPPEEHEYDDVITETDQRSVQHERTTPRRGLHQNPPAPITPAYVNVGTGFNRFRNEDPVTVHDMRMNGTSSSPLYANTEQTTVFHR